MANVLNTAAIRALLGKLAGDAGQTVTAATNASPSVATLAGNGYGPGDVVFIVGTTGNTAINGVRVVTPVDANTFTMTDLFTGAAVNGNGTFGGTVHSFRIFDNKVAGDLVDLLSAMDKVSSKYGPGEDSNRANETAIQAVFGA